MSRHEDFDNGFWSEPDVELLSLEATALYIWSWTNTRCGMAGLYKVSRRTMTECKVPAERLDDALAELADARFLFYEQQALFVRTRVKRLRQKTVQIAKSIAKDVAKLPGDHPMRIAFLHEYSGHAWLREHLAGLDSHLTLTGPSPESHQTPLGKPNLRHSVEGHPTLHGNGNGYGKGNGPKGWGSGGRDWAAWCRQHVSDLPVELAEGAAAMIAFSGRDVTADGVRRRVLANHPELRDDATSGKDAA